MVPEDRSDGPGAGEESARLQAGPIRKGCDLSADSPPGRLQSHRARIHQQIDRELRMRTGAENLYRATSNARVRETVALELSDVNSSLQLLKEELAGLDSSGDTGQPESEGVTAPMIPLGLKETKPLDWAPSLKELICRHFGEDGASYEAEIRELEELRQATRTPSRSKAGLELLTAYYNQLCFLEARFVTPAQSLGLLFHWYDSLTGLPAQQRALAFEKGSVLFNIGALHTQIGAHQNRSCPEGISRALEAFQRAAGAFSLLRENFSHAPSPDMSAASLSMLEKLMSAQAQECVFEGLLLQAPGAAHDCLAQLRLAQEAAQVAAEYRLVHRTMVQPPVRDYVPFPWTTLVHVKAEHFHALAHYHAALGLCDGAPVAESELPILEKVFLASAEARGPVLPQEREERSKLGKAHLRRALLGQEAALQLHAVCRALRWEDLLQAVLARALRRSLAKYSELDLEDDFHEATEAPDIQPKTQQRAEGRTPSFSRVKVADIFHRLVSTLPGLPFLSSLLAFRQVLEGGPTLPSPPADATSLSPNGEMRARVPQAGGAPPSAAAQPGLCPPPGAPVRVLSQESLAAGGAHSPVSRRGGLRLHAAGRLACSHCCRRSRGPGCGGRPEGGRPHRVGERAAVQVVEARGGGGPAEGCGQRGCEPAGGHAAACCRAARLGAPPASPWGASEKPEGVWPRDTSALTSQPEAQAPPWLEPQGQQGQDWKKAVPSPTALSCLLPLPSGLPRVAVRGRLLPYKGPHAASSWLGARTLCRPS